MVNVDGFTGSLILFYLPNNTMGLGIGICPRNLSHDFPKAWPGSALTCPVPLELSKQQHLETSKGQCCSGRKSVASQSPFEAWVHSWPGEPEEPREPGELAALLQLPGQAAEVQVQSLRQLRFGSFVLQVASWESFFAS